MGWTLPSSKEYCCFTDVLVDVVGELRRMRIDGIRGGGYTQQSNDEGVHGEHLFARKLYYNDVIDKRMKTTTTTRIQWCWQWGLLLMQ
jgi:hypothetical protein